MELPRSLGIIALLSVMNFCSCGSTNLTTVPTITGNWVISAEIPNPGVLDPTGNPTYTTVNSWAYLSQDGTSVSGMVVDNLCYPSTFPVSGSLNSGHLRLMGEVTLPTEVENFLLDATVSPNLTTLQGDSIINPSHCGVSPVFMTNGQQVESFAGTWTGILTSVSGPSATVSVTITEGGPGVNGFPDLSGNVIFSNSPCFTSGTLAGNQTGNLLSGIIKTTDGTIEIPQIGGMSAFLDPSNQMVISYSVQGGTCNGDYDQGTLTRR